MEVFQLKDIYLKRPFKTRNADEYDISQILSLFVSPLEGLTSPFDFENSIIKGRMGSGKTMYLRANNAYYLYSIIPSLINKEELILPVMIKLSDFQHLTEPSEIYKAIIIKIIEELSSVYIWLQNADRLARVHSGVKSLTSNTGYNQKISNSLRQLAKLGADEYIERVTTELGLSGGVKHEFLELSSKYKKNELIELKQKSNPGIKDLENCYKNLLEDREGKILLLIDEAGALDKKFFKGQENNSFFEILMNQFRTAPYIRTKIAIYPNSYQDILTETRYGDNILLEENINEIVGYEKIRNKTNAIIKNYVNENIESPIQPEAIFEIKDNSIYGDCLEQLIYASNGNLRRLIQLLDSAMETAYNEHNGEGKITLTHAFDTLKRHSERAENLYTIPERDFLNPIVTACRSRSTYRFQFPNMSPVLNKYTSRSQEFNLMNIIEIGIGRRSTTYAFDYSYCVANEIPTHYHTDSEKINRERTLLTGRWITRVTKISEDIITQANVPGKIEGIIVFLKESKGFIRGDDDKDYYFMDSYIIEEDSKKPIFESKRVRFFPTKVIDSYLATLIEIL